jgi:hypothetical protein
MLSQTKMTTPVPSAQTANEIAMAIGNWKLVHRFPAVLLARPVEAAHRLEGIR